MISDALKLIAIALIFALGWWGSAVVETPIPTV